MAINKKLIHFKNKENFDNEVANGNILDNSIVFIQDSKEISTHGTVYKTVNWEYLPWEFIDLGLSVKWASCNIGASNPEDTGLYFQWGDIKGYEVQINEDNSLIIEDNHIFDKAHYVHSDGTNFIKYSNGAKLDISDDSAANMYSRMRIPTQNESKELWYNTNRSWEIINGMGGIRFTSKTNNNSIFIPASGGIVGSEISGYSNNGYIMSSELHSGRDTSFLDIYFSSNQGGEGNVNREYGFPIRPVKSK